MIQYKESLLRLYNFKRLFHFNIKRSPLFIVYICIINFYKT